MFKVGKNKIKVHMGKTDRCYLFYKHTNHTSYTTGEDFSFVYYLYSTNILLNNTKDKKNIKHHKTDIRTVKQHSD